MTEERILLLGCGILRKEIRHLIAKNNWALDTFFIDSMLHVDFEALESALRKALARNAGRRILVFYGTCHPLMDQLLQEAAVARTTGQNCVEMLLGNEKFTHELSNGAYFLLEDWALRWDYMILKTFGTNPTVTSAIFQGDRSNFLCLRTPCSGDYTAQAEAVSHQIGLPLRWLDVSLEHLEAYLSDAITSMNRVAQ
ncbi:MAG: DUF1638 domain-containing protein [Desulfuromonadaceae bacterium]|nr:DUF1638 domain-containing protein [Desulfuromonadaceae bacterium]